MQTEVVTVMEIKIWALKFGRQDKYTWCLACTFLESEENPYVPTFDTCVKSLLTKVFENIHERSNSITTVPRRVEKGVSDKHPLL